jgi:hypothetical protein
MGGTAVHEHPLVERHGGVDIFAAFEQPTVFVDEVRLSFRADHDLG